MQDRQAGTHRLQSTVGLTVEPVPVLDAAEESADVDKVKGVLPIHPLVLGVVDFESDVGGNIARLHW